MNEENPEVILEEIVAVSDYRGIIWHVSWDWKGRRLVSCGGDRIVRIWKYDPVTNILSLSDKLCGAHSKTTRSAAFSPDGHRLAVASFDGTVSIWNEISSGTAGSSQWKCVANLEGHENEVKSVSWSSDGRLLASCGRDKTVWIWESSLEDNEFEVVAVLADHSQDVKHVKWHPYDLILGSASYDETVRLWTCDADDDDWFATSCLAGHASTVWAFDFDPTGNYFISGSDDNSLVLWKRFYGPSRLPVKYEPLQRIWNAHNRAIYSVSWYPEGGLISEQDEFDAESLKRRLSSHMFVASGSSDRSIAIWSAKCIPKEVEGEEPKGFPYVLEDFHLAKRIGDAHETEVNCVAWNPRFPLLVSCDDEGCIKLWSFEHG